MMTLNTAFLGHEQDRAARATLEAVPDMGQ
jgi:hypothetical protein